MASPDGGPRAPALGRWVEGQEAGETGRGWIMKELLVYMKCLGFYTKSSSKLLKVLGMRLNWVLKSSLPAVGRWIRKGKRILGRSGNGISWWEIIVARCCSLGSQEQMLGWSLVGRAFILSHVREERKQDWAEGKAKSQCSRDKATANPTRSSGVHLVWQMSLISTEWPGI